jgi:pyruvate/2-oxoglutarate dehydrogenase complex dihydrolipoamide acyltransferase (E2) component
MAVPVYAPRVNNNDDVVQVVSLRVGEGDSIKAGEILAEVETDKAVLEVEAERDGHVLKVSCEESDQIAVGSIMMWIGASPSEPVPVAVSSGVKGYFAGARLAQPTAKARALLRRHNLSAAEIPCTGERLSAADVEAYVSRKLALAHSHGAENRILGPPSDDKIEEIPQVPGKRLPLNEEERGMISTVLWHRDHAVPAYLETEYDPRAWERYAGAYAENHKLMLSPLLALMAYRLVRLAQDAPRVNCTLVSDAKYQYEHVNLGFTVQAGDTLYLTVVQKADTLDIAGFIDALGMALRHAMARKLKPSESQGATVSFSSMARWNVSRHAPVLPPYTSLIVAHAAPQGSTKALLGATYDHRLLTGFDVASLLQKLSQPSE